MTISHARLVLSEHDRFSERSPLPHKHKDAQKGMPARSIPFFLIGQNTYGIGFWPKRIWNRPSRGQKRYEIGCLWTKHPWNRPSKNLFHAHSGQKPILCTFCPQTYSRLSSTTSYCSVLPAKGWLKSMVTWVSVASMTRTGIFKPFFGFLRPKTEPTSRDSPPGSITRG